MAKIHFLNVDEGDCSIIQHDNGKVTMIDICCGNIIEQQPFIVAFCGDAGMGTINHLLEKHQTDISDLDVLIAPHHGRDSDKDFSFLDVMKPKLTLVGNAKCQHLAYNEWNSRGLEHIQNNQGANILIDIHNNGEMHVSCSNKSFADAYRLEYFKKVGAIKDSRNMGY